VAGKRKRIPAYSVTQPTQVLCWPRSKWKLCWPSYNLSTGNRKEDIGMKTIRMPKEFGDKWLAALRSGKYKQGRDLLHNLTTDGYCCLGVLQMEVCGSVEESAPGKPAAVPTMEWLQKNNIQFYHFHYNEPRINPDLLSSSAAAMNDSGKSFYEIADEIEACMEYTDENV
jgi:hypothetical protein